MVQYTFAQAPEVILVVPGKDSAKARDQAMDQLFTLLDEGTLAIDLPDHFGPRQFIEVKEPPPVVEVEAAIAQAIQTLGNFAALKLKWQESRLEALQIHAKLDLLFADADASATEILNLKEGFKALKQFAQAYQRYQEGRIEAEAARAVLDQALQ